MRVLLVALLLSGCTTYNVTYNVTVDLYNTVEVKKTQPSVRNSDNPYYDRRTNP